MAYKVQYKRSVEKDLERLDKRDARRILDKLEKELSTHPDRHPTLKGEFAGLRKMRLGNYRVIYALLENEVLILRLENRKDVYR